MNTVSNNMSAATESKNYVFFPFYIYNDDDEFVKGDSARLELTEDVIKRIAAEMEQENAGYPVEMSGLMWLQQMVAEQVYNEDIERVLPGEEDYSDYYVSFGQQMPDELVKYADKYVRFKGVTQTFYINNDGEEVKDSFLYQISKKAFDAMVEVLTTRDDSKSDYQQLKERFPEIYNEVAGDPLEQGLKWSIAHYDEPKEVTLKEFPIEIYGKAGLIDLF